MKCIDEEKLWEYLDNELTKEEVLQIEEHLTQCSHCNKNLDDLMFFNTQFSNAVHEIKEDKINPIKNCLVEIELGYNEIKPQFKKYWKGIVAFGGITVLLTLMFVTLACPVSNKMIFESEFNSVTYYISQFLYFMAKPIIMNVWVIVLTFSFLFWVDRQLVVLNRQLQG
ncbi:MAG: zf-HC2 domain-containing protein [Saprospiraceae bacterium]